MTTHDQLIEKGRVQGQQATAMQIAEKLLRKHASVDEIQELTELDPKMIMALKEKNPEIT